MGNAKTAPTCGEGGCSCKPTELEKQQLDYAWKWFALHTDQRIKDYNFMLVAFAFTAAAIVTAIDKNLPWLAGVVLCLFAAALAGAFILLDRRNRDLVWLSEDHTGPTLLRPS